MAGSWEFPKHRLDVLVGIIHTDFTSVKWGFGLRMLRLPQRWDIGEATGQPYDMGRNTLAKMALEMDAEWLFFLDSDVVVPPDCLEKLMALGHPLVSGIYHRRRVPFGPALWMENDKGVEMLRDYPKTAPFSVDLAGAGCLLIHNSILKRLPVTRENPWFLWTIDKKPRPEGCSEDFYFLRRCRKELDIRPLAHPLVECEHLGLFMSGKDGAIPAGDSRKKDRFGWVRERAIGTIVDIGCHDGQMFGPEAYKDKVTGVDLDVYSLQNFVRSNADDMPFPDRHFDTAVLAEILEHVPDPIKVLKEAKRVTRHKILLTIPNEHEWDARHKPLHTKEEEMETRGIGWDELVAEGTKGALAVTDEKKVPHLYHVRHYDEKTLRRDLKEVFGGKYVLDVLRYDGWSFFVVEVTL
jgi:SAM-dependent methyltransferase